MFMQGTPGWGGWNSSNMVFMEGGFQQWRCEQAWQEFCLGMR